MISLFNVERKHMSIGVLDLLDKQNDVFNIIGEIDVVNNTINKAAIVDKSITTIETLVGSIDDKSMRDKIAITTTSVTLSQVGISDNEIDILFNETVEATASIGSILKDTWELFKEGAKKVWGFIHDLLKSLLNFISSLVSSNKHSDTSYRYPSSTNKHKTITTDGFQEDLKKDIAKDIAYILHNKTKPLSYKDYEEYIDVLEDTLLHIVKPKEYVFDSKSILDSVKIHNHGLNLLGVTFEYNHHLSPYIILIDISNGTYKVTDGGYVLTKEEIDDIDIPEFKKVIKELDKNIHKVYDLFSDSLEVVETIYSKKLDLSEYKDIVDINILENEIPDDIVYGIIKPVGINGKKVILNLIHGTDTGYEEYRSYISSTDNTIENYLNVVNSIYVKEITIIFDKVDYSLIEPLEYLDIELLEDKISTIHKSLLKHIKTYKKDMEKIMHDALKELDDLDKKEYRKHFRDNYIKILQDITSINTKGIAITSMELANTSLKRLLKESLTLYENSMR